MQTILNKYCFKKNGLFILPPPTGSGKTFNVIQFIANNYKEFKRQGRKILFITNLKKNLPYEDLKKYLSPEEYEENVLFLNSNAGMLQEHFNDIDGDENCSFLSKQDCYKKFKEYNNDWKSVSPSVRELIKEEILTELEPAIRKQIVEHLDEELPSSLNDKFSELKSNPKYQWIIDLYPSVFTEEKTIIFMSIDKYFLKTATLVKKAFYTYEQLSQDSLIFIDEFDSSKKSILNRIVEKKNIIDVVELFTQIYTHLSLNEFPQYLLKAADKWTPTKFADQPIDILSSLTKEASQIVEEFNLTLTCKSKAATGNDDRIFLFHDHAYHNLLGAEGNSIELEPDENLKTNWLIKKKSEERNYKQSIDKLLVRIEGFLKFFKTGVSILAQNYWNRQILIKPDFELEDSIRTILNQLMIKDRTITILVEEILAGFKPKTESSIFSEKLQSNTFFDQGFCYYDVVDSYDHYSRSKLYMYNYTKTPESWLGDICNKGMVVGISATGTFPTNLYNYDLDYLKTRLKERFYSLTTEEVSKIKDTYDNATKGYNAIDIQADFIDPGSNHEEYLATLTTLFNDEATAEEFINEIKGYFTAYEFILKRYIRLFIAFEYFCKNKCRSFLALFMPIPKNNDNKFNLSLICTHADVILKRYYPTCDVPIKNIIVALGGDSFDDAKDKLLNDLSNAKSRFIISSYQSMGIGQNMQFDIPQGAEFITTNDFNTKHKMDIEGIYLDNITQVLVNLNNPQVIKPKEAVRHFFEIEYLLENGDISLRDFNVELKRTVQKLDNPVVPRKQHGQTDNYRTSNKEYAVLSQIVQAVGRIARTNHKAKTIHVLADQELLQVVANRPVPYDTIALHEYTALYDVACKFYLPSDTAALHTEFLERRESIKSVKGMGLIRKVLNGVWNESIIQSWQDFRKITLKYPCNPPEEILATYQRMYVHLPVPALQYSYNQRGDYRDIEVKFDPTIGDQVVNEEKSRLKELLAVPCLLQLFKDKGYALNFTKSLYLLSPPFFNNIYKGALGEVCGEHLLKTTINIELEELESEIYERFDFKVISQNYYIDFKLYNDMVGNPAKDELDKIQSKAIKINAKRVYVINILSTTNEGFTPNITRFDEDREVIEIPFLIQGGNVSDDAIKYLYKNIKG